MADCGAMPRATSLTLRDLALLRLRNQRLLDKRCKTPAEAVGWLCAVQSQDYYGAKWALAQRTQGADDASVERAYDTGAILRTHVLRPTWHFVLPADIRWMLALTGPRVRALLRYYDKQLGIDAPVLKRSAAAISSVLRGGKFATRNELASALRDEGIGIAAEGSEPAGQRLAHLLMHAELDALVCSGPRRGKQLTYALLEERAPEAVPRSRERALAELTLRYFTSHGPALPQDFAWWSGLTITDAKAGLAAVGGKLSQLEIDGRIYWHARASDAKPPRPRAPIVHMLPNYDEHLIAYKERSAAFDRERVKVAGSRDNPIFNHLVTLNGQVIGGWKRTQASKNVETTLLASIRLSAPEQKALKKAQSTLARYLEGEPVS